MDLLIDTQAFLWFENGDPNLTTVAKNAILNTNNNKFISIASFWEIAIKNSLGKLELEVSFDELLSLSGYSHLQINGEHLKLILSLPFHHRDPFDRLIIAQSIQGKFTIVSADEKFDLYGVNRIW